MGNSDFMHKNGNHSLTINIEGGVQPIRYVTVGSGRAREVAGTVIEETHVCTSVNGEELATFMAT
ncbi:MAG TPA: hypothetical protein EYH05_02220, partial [Anaerolineae bacterium]|nr:hypothetical protein [Anaerolineae bacterium]